MNKNEVFFRIAFSYSDFDEQGKPAKQKKEVIVSAINYTDAEGVAIEILKDLQDNSADADYDIKRINKKSEFLLTDVFSVNDELTRGLVNYYLAGEENESGIYNVSIHFSEISDKGTKKVSKEEIFVAAINSKEAYNIVYKFLKHIETRDFSIKDIKCDKADEILVTDLQHQYLTSKSEMAGLL